MTGANFHLLDDVHVMLRDTASEFCSNVVAPLAEEVDAHDAFLKDLWPQIGDLGLHGVTVEEQYGGAGLGYLAHSIVTEEMSRASGSIGISYIAHSNLCINQLRLNGTTEQKKRFLPHLIAGEKVGALAMSEAGAGSDVVSMTLRADRRGDYYVLNGTKLWTTNGWFADTYIVYAKTDVGSGKTGITAFIVERDTAGFARTQKLDKLGMRGSGTCELLFEDCEVPVENVLGVENRGVGILMSGLDYERIIAAAASVGLMQAAVDVTLPYLQERKQFGKPIGSFQLMQGKLADMVTALNASRSYLYAAAKAADAGQSLRAEAASVVLFCAENGTKLALEAIQALGGNGYINDYSTGRLLRDAKLYEIGAGTSEIRRMLIGRETLGLHS